MRTLAGNFIALIVVAHAVLVQAQTPPKPYGAGETRGQVVDADSGAPVEGAIVVARWEWREHRYGIVLGHMGGGVRSTQTVHTGEAVSNAQGHFTVAQWTAMKAGGDVEEDMPRLLAFKSGYEPLSQTAKSGNTLRLKKFAGEPKAYAQLIEQFQDGRGGLEWSFDQDSFAIPKMVTALHRERIRLGADGTAIASPEKMPNRSGALHLVDAATKMEPNEHGVIWIEWTMRRIDGAPGTRRVVQTLPTSSLLERYIPVSPWRLPGPQVAGWEIDPALKPLVRVYVTGYQRSADVRWEEKGGTIAVTRLDGSRESVLAELRARRKDIDAQLAQGDRAEALALQEPMLANFQFQCARLTPDLRAELCFAVDSDVARAVYAANHRDVVERRPTAPAQQAMPMPARLPSTIPVKGFTIELAQ